LRNAPKSRFALLRGIVTNKFWSVVDWNYDTLILYAWESESLTENQLLYLINRLARLPLNLVDLLLKLPVEVWIAHLEAYVEVLPELAAKMDVSNYRLLLLESERVQLAWWQYLRVVIADTPDGFLHFMLDHENGLFAQDVLALLGDKVFRILFDWMNLSERMPVVEWQYLIVLNPAGAFKQLSLSKQFNIHTLSLFLANVSPTNPEWRKVSIKNFIRFFEQCEKYPTSPVKTAVYTYFMTTCFTGNAARPDLLVQFLFQPLHDSLESSVCERDSWQRFKMELGRDLYVLLELDFFSKHFKDRQEVPDWDRCEFLRRSLLSAFLKFQWNIANLLNVIRNERTFEKTIEFGVDVKPVRKLLKGLKKALESDVLSKPAYLKILKRNL
jgi:hypothetical protein